MKNLAVFIMLAALGLAGCGQDQPAGDTAAEDSTPPAVAEDSVPEPDAEPSADDDAGTAPTLVEESAAEVAEADDDEVPLMLAQADSGASGNWEYEEGDHFQRLVPAQPTVGGADKIEVAEIFWYGCGHCMNFEPYINRWAENKPANVRFVRIPAMWNPLVKLHAQLYYTEEVLAKNGLLEKPEEFRAAVFREYHQRGNRLASENAIAELFERFGVAREEFDKTWGSFEVAQKMRVADDLARRYGVSAVPAVVVNGKYRTGASRDIGYPDLLEIIDELVARESQG